ncbi:MAG: hypothetical protein EHM35_14105 [Planctomycetaceae bacterium]|nr:MAG: hypothetical protein EHM35_14105 [Planctomycetaceae bacterium]
MVELSILVATVSSRRGLLSRLLSVLEPQVKGDPYSEVIVHQGERKSMGRKFDDLYAAANGRLSVQVDDDDLVADDFVMQVLAASVGHDFVGYKIKVTVDGDPQAQIYEINPARAKVLKPYDPRDLIRFVTPKCPILTRLARRFPFPSYFGADYFWTEDLVRDGYPFNPVFIPKVLYHYDAWPNHSLGTRPSEWTEQREVPEQDYDRHSFTWIGRGVQ